MIGALGVVLLLILIVIGLPVGIAMGVTGFLGLLVLKGWQAALGGLFFLPHTAVASFTLAVIPMFLLMGYLAFYLGLTDKAYDAAFKWTHRVKGGLGVATMLAAAIFGACCGSSVAATAAFGRMALPQMLARKYDPRLAAGCVASAGTLAALIPPSILFVLYGIVTEVSVSKLLIAGVMPGILTALMFSLSIVILVKFKPHLAPMQAEDIIFTLREKLSAIKDLLPVAVLFLVIVGGIYSGLFTPTEAGAAGSVVCLIVGFAGRKVTWNVLWEVTLETARSVAIIGVLMVGVFLLVQFVSFSGLPSFIAKTVSEWNVPLAVTLLGIYVVYLILGCFLDAFGLVLLTVPFFFPVILNLGLDAIWFGVIVVKLAEIGLLTPPVGIQIYVLKSVAPEGMTTETIFKGAMWFWIIDLITIVLLSLFPIISLWLPNMMKG